MITFPNGFKITSKEPIDSRFVMSKDEMLAVKTPQMPNVYFTVCSDDGQLYVYNSGNQIDPNTGRFRLANEKVLKAIEQLADEQSIIYLDDLNKLSIKGYINAAQGQMLVKDRVNGLAWVDPVDLTTLNQAVADSQDAARQAGTYATTAGNKAVEATDAANAAYESAVAIRDMYWFGTMEEYNNLPVIEENKVYVVLMR